jgi:plasmid stabilization system protein ParE
MKDKKLKAPKSERRFGNLWGELDYLCKKIRYWLYVRKQRAGAARYLNRLQRVLRHLPENDEAIIREEGYALLSELRGHLRDAIAHREREIRLTELLHKDAQSVNYADSTRAYMLQDRGIADLAERRAILEALREQEALRQEPRRLTKSNRIGSPCAASAC